MKEVNRGKVVLRWKEEFVYLHYKKHHQINLGGVRAFLRMLSEEL